MRRSFLILLTLLTSVLAQASPLRIVFPSNGAYDVWYADALPINAPNPTPQAMSGGSGDIDEGTGHLCALDKATGNLAEVSRAPTNGTLTLQPKDFNKVFEMQVTVQQGAGSLDSGTVAISGPHGSRTQILDPGKKGLATFYDLDFGQQKVTVQYAGRDGNAAHVVQLVEVTAQHSDPVLHVSIAVPNQVGTSPKPLLPDSPAVASPTPPATNKQSLGNLVGKIVTMLLGLGVVAGVAYGLYFLFKKDPGAVEKRLSAMGVNIPKAPGAPLDDPLPSMAAPAPPQPVQKIILDDSEPTPLAPSSPSVPTGTAPGFSDRPRLVRANGEELVVQDGTTQVGREPGLGLSLVEEPTLSRQHAEIIRNGREIALRDLGSTNGTFVNGRKVDGEVALAPGDAVQFGAVQFTILA